jgi:hypothetical protein
MGAGVFVACSCSAQRGARARLCEIHESAAFMHPIVRCECESARVRECECEYECEYDCECDCECECECEKDGGVPTFFAPWVPSSSYSAPDLAWRGVRVRAPLN